MIMSNATECTDDKKENCEHWNTETNTCPYLRKLDDYETCFIGGIEKRYEKDERNS